MTSPTPPRGSVALCAECGHEERDHFSHAVSDAPLCPIQRATAWTTFVPAPSSDSGATGDEREYDAGAPWAIRKEFVKQLQEKLAAAERRAVEAEALNERLVRAARRVCQESGPDMPPSLGSIEALAVAIASASRTGETADG